jgi:hypothetical protein
MILGSLYPVKRVACLSDEQVKNPPIPGIFQIFFFP